MIKALLQKLTIIWAVIFASGCKSTQHVTTPVPSAQPAAIIYTTKADYHNNVPVTLSADGKQIVSYPAPADVYYNGKLAYPTALAKGYWLDNRGISPNTAFLKYTYQQYSALKSVPTTAELMEAIVDAHPIKSMYNLGARNRFKNEVEEINAIIANGQLKQYQKLK